MTNAEQNLYRMPGIFEVHLETPKVDSSVLTRVFEELSDVGFIRNMPFRGVYYT
ncbi:MAG: hypothetical protein FD167_5521 [bacterium]|nr:MAG: hypothetical protein FD167_5521 [bacterium]